MVNASYQFTFNNSQHQYQSTVTADIIFSSCGGTNVIVHKHSLTLTGIIVDTNTVTLSINNSAGSVIGISEVLVVAQRCGGIQGV